MKKNIKILLINNCTPTKPTWFTILSLIFKHQNLSIQYKYIQMTFIGKDQNQIYVKFFQDLKEVFKAEVGIKRPDT